MIEAGKFYKFKVTRKTDLGFMLNDGEIEVLMHYRQSSREYEIGEMLSAFIYYDKKGRLCATDKNILLTTTRPGMASVCEVHDEGIFLDINTSKDVFLSKDYLPYKRELWPQVGDHVYAILKLKKDSLVAKPINKELCLKFKEGTVIEGESLDGVVSVINNGGYGIVTANLNYVFVPTIMTRKSYHLGEKVFVKITKVTVNDIYGSLIQQKEKQMTSDKDLILAYLKTHNNYMPFTAKSSSEVIEMEFKMSRKAFKRAYGELYKERVIDFDEKGTKLLKV